MRFNGESTSATGRLRDDRGELGIRISAKQWGELSHMEDESAAQSEIRDLLTDQKSRTRPALSKLPGRNTRLYNAVKFIDMPEM